MAEPVQDAVKVPSTDRGRRTRARVVEAARRVFERSGFLDARINDIADEAGVAYGTFYTYFSTKEDVFREVAQVLQAEMLQRRPHEETPARSLLPIERVERANRRYLESYVINARLMAVVEQVSTISPELLEIRQEVRTAFVERSRRAIARWQEEGYADPDLDPYYAASALGSMVDRFAYVWLVLGGDFELERAVQTLTRLWVQALDLGARPRKRRRSG